MRSNPFLHHILDERHVHKLRIHSQVLDVFVLILKSGTNLYPGINNRIYQAKMPRKHTLRRSSVKKRRIQLGGRKQRGGFLGTMLRAGRLVDGILKNKLGIGSLRRRRRRRAY